MLSTALTSERAIQVNIAMMRVFITLRHALLSSRELVHRVEKLEGKVDMHDTDIRLLVKGVELANQNSTLGKDSKRIKGFVTDDDLRG